MAFPFLTLLISLSVYGELEGREGVCKTKGIDIWMVAHIVFFFLLFFRS